MKRFPKTFPSNRNLTGTALTVVVLLSAVLATRADASVRVSVDLRMPHVSVAVNSHDLRCGMPPVRPVERVDIIITRSDRKTARALAHQYDCCQTTLLDMRRAGYNWWEIREILSSPPRLARAALRHYHVCHLACAELDDRHDDRHRRPHHRGHGGH